MNASTPSAAVSWASRSAAPAATITNSIPFSNKDYYALAGVFASTAAAVRPLDSVDPEVEKRFLWVRQRLGDLDSRLSREL